MKIKTLKIDNNTLSGGEGKLSSKVWLPGTKMAHSRRMYAMDIRSKLRVSAKDFATVSPKA